MAHKFGWNLGCRRDRNNLQILCRYPTRNLHNLRKNSISKVCTSITTIKRAFCTCVSSYEALLYYLPVLYIIVGVSHVWTRTGQCQKDQLKQTIDVGIYKTVTAPHFQNLKAPGTFSLALTDVSNTINHPYEMRKRNNGTGRTAFSTEADLTPCV